MDGIPRAFVSRVVRLRVHKRVHSVCCFFKITRQATAALPQPRHLNLRRRQHNPGSFYSRRESTSGTRNGRAPVPTTSTEAAPAQPLQHSHLQHSQLQLSQLQLSLLRHRRSQPRRLQQTAKQVDAADANKSAPAKSDATAETTATTQAPSKPSTKEPAPAILRRLLFGCGCLSLSQWDCGSSCVDAIGLPNVHDLRLSPLQLLQQRNKPRRQRTSNVRSRLAN